MRAYLHSRRAWCESPLRKGDANCIAGSRGAACSLNYVNWESTDAFQHGFKSPELQAQLKQYPAGTEVSAFMFRRVAVPEMCLGEPVASD
jgi:hypothetical protein